MKHFQVILFTIASCAAVAKGITCKAGEGIHPYTIYDTLNTGSCTKTIKSNEECIAAQILNAKQRVVVPVDDGDKFYRDSEKDDARTGCFIHMYQPPELSTNQDSYGKSSIGYGFNTINNIQTRRASCSLTYACVCADEQCITCAPGKYSDGKSACKDCPPGTSQELSGQSRCVACESGKYSDYYGGVYCISCPQVQVGNTMIQQVVNASSSGCFTPPVTTTSPPSTTTAAPDKLSNAYESKTSMFIFSVLMCMYVLFWP
jgi:hypothetical protein